VKNVKRLPEADSSRRHSFWLGYFLDSFHTHSTVTTQLDVWLRYTNTADTRSLVYLLCGSFASIWSYTL